MKLTEQERIKLADKAYWEWQAAKMELRMTDMFHPENFKKVYKEERRCRKRYYKLVGRRKR